jgi:hypothetical protein
MSIAEGIVVKFKEDNNLQYSQDFRVWRGIPAGIDFKLVEQGSAIVLRGIGYGEKGFYGNGPIFLSGAQRTAIKEYLRGN